MLLQEVWDGLGQETKDWFRQNPGCRVLPRTLVNIVSDGYSGPVMVDQDGMMALSAADLTFLHGQKQSMARPGPAGQTPRERT
ncbi:hypothetical protein NHF46_07930 [Arthrobacter alpinus]|uniref:Uncharacterized protein n=1 Tax=Arthrobacter alpinus TaxID=656366 RepID=A0A0S2M1B1_9MICC|nr:hypothetical protein [Arthrobacter alpinus]ALO67304.1 hypothetical protein AS189_13335 [Arthrobacter alpinus]MDD0857686.1 hypothetical protein [Arthrobacter alpinus]